jgi:hypothetical protein
MDLHCETIREAEPGFSSNSKDHFLNQIHILAQYSFQLEDVYFSSNWHGTWTMFYSTNFIVLGSSLTNRWKSWSVIS